MASTGLFVFVALITVCRAVHMCTSVNSLKGIEKGRMCPGRQIENLTTSEMMTCSRACLTRRMCKSYNFNVITGECQLNSKADGSLLTQLIAHRDYVFVTISVWPDTLAGACAGHSCPLNSYCHSVSNTGHVCKIIGCLGTPRVENGLINRTSSRQDSPLGTVLPFICDPGYLPQGEAVCQNNGTWSSPVCVSVSSCSMVKQYQPDSEDGEYWLRLPTFDNYTTRIYCHGMSTSAPREFLTFININYGVRPNIQSSGCKVETTVYGGGVADCGEVWFNKIRVNISSFEVFQNDWTFANITSKTLGYFKYGTSSDCYTHHPGNQLRCGTRGRFTIDLRGTGWMVREDQQWTTIENLSIIEAIDRTKNGTLIVLKCGGYCGGCTPKAGLFLLPFPEKY